LTIVVICPSCGHRAGAKEEWVGKQVKCPDCGGTITITMPAKDASPAVSSPRPAQPRSSASAAKPSLQQRGTAAPAPPRPRAPAGQRAGAAPPQRPIDAAPVQNGGIFDLLGDINPSAGDQLGAALAGPALGAPLGPTVASLKRKKGGSSKTVWIVLGSVGGVLILGCAGLFLVGLVSGFRAARQSATLARASTPLPTNLPVLSPDASLVNQLGPDVTFDRYSIRLPNGYAATNMPFSAPPPSGVQMRNWIWADAPAPDGTRHVITAILADSQNERHSNNLDGEMNAYLQGARGKVPAGAALLPGSTRKGQILGRPFGRVTYTIATPQVSLHSISYLGFDGDKRILTLICACKEQEGSETYKLLETSLLTLKLP
jgi:hypothetical protein